MKTIPGSNSPFLPDNNNVNDEESAASVNTYQNPSVQPDQKALENWLGEQGLSRNDYAQLSQLVAAAAEQGISVNELVGLYPQIAGYKDALNAMMQLQLNSAKMNTQSASLPEDTELSSDKRANLGHIATLLTQLGPDATEQEIEDSGVAGLLENLSPTERNALYGLLTVSNEKKEPTNLKPTVTPDNITPKSTQPKINSASSDLLQTADAAYKNSDYDGAFKAYQSALKADPDLSKSWPTIYYQLGVCSEYAKDAALNTGANGFYKLYLQSPKPDPKVAEWVQKESQWLTDKPQAENLAQAADDQLYKENNAPKAFSILKNAIEQFPELAKREPGVYYTLAMSAFSASDLSAAKKYLDLAKTAMQDMLTQDPGSKYAKDYMGRISDLTSQVQDPNLTTTIASYLGDKIGGRGFWTEFLNGISNVWISRDGDLAPGRGQSSSGNQNYLESKLLSDWDAKADAKAIGRTPSLAEQKELYHNSEEVHKSEQQVEHLTKELKNASGDKNLIEAQKNLDTAQIQLQAAKQTQQEFIAAAKKGEVASAEYAAETWTKTVTSDTDLRDTLKTELAAAKTSNEPKADIEALTKKLADAEKNLKTSTENATAAATNSQKAQVAAAATSALTPADKATLQKATDDYGAITKKTKDLIEQHDALVDEDKQARSDNKPTADIEAKLKANATQLQSAIAEGKTAQAGYEGTVAKINKDIATHETTTKSISSEGHETETTHSISPEGNVTKTTSSVTPEGKSTVTESINDGVKRTETSSTTTDAKTGKTVDNYNTVKEGNIGSVRTSVTTRKITDINELGPGYWGLGTTLDHQQAAAYQWSLGTDADGKISSNSRGPFTTTSNEDPTQSGVTIASGGSGSDEYSLSISGGANVGNVEHRDYDMTFGGSTGGGMGVGGMIGSQARADLVDEQFGLNYAGGETSIGGEKIKNLVTASASEQASIGAQADASVTAGIGKDGAALGASAGAFAGAQVSGMASGSVDGVGAAVIAQGWAGVGIKGEANASIKDGKLNLDLGFGAALGVGGYVNFNVTIDFNQIGQELKGIGTEGVDLAKKWGDKVPGLGQVAGFIAGTAVAAGKFALSTLDAVSTLASGAGKVMDSVQGAADKFASNTLHMGRTGAALVDAAALVSGETTVADALEIGTTAKDAWNKSVSDDLSAAKDDASSGHIVKAGVEGFIGGAKYVGEKIEDGPVFSGIKSFFTGGVNW